MPKIIERPTVRMEVVIQLSEQEAGALDALFGYDADVFLATFYEKIGKAYLQPYEEGFRSLHAARGFLSGALRRAKIAREVFEKA
jgi:hypothetical protein